MSHHLKPIVLIGNNGYNDNVSKYIKIAFNKNELIKIKFNHHKENKSKILDRILIDTDSSLVQIVGNIATIYKQMKD